MEPRVVENQGKSLGLLALSLALIGSSYLVSRSWAHVKLRPPDRKMEVTGSAKRRIVSDVIEWTATITTHDLDRVTAYKKLHDHVGKAQAFLRAQGLKDAEVRVSSVTTQELYDTVTEGDGYSRIRAADLQGAPDGAAHRRGARRTCRASSGCHARSPSSSSRASPSRSSRPSYYYTRLGALKIEMLAEATKDARNRASNMVDSAGGGKLGKLRHADMGVINVNPANSTDTSWDGNNDTGSLEKDIITIVHVNYDLK